MADSSEAMRLDLALVARGLMESRALAQAAIKAGGVTVDGVVVSKPSMKITPDQKLGAERPYPHVSRGGLKLAHGLEVFKVSASGRICLDIGASTGGFTDVLLRGGAKMVYAVDVGHDQLHASLRNDPRVVSLEAMDARRLDSRIIPQVPDLLVCDASFIMLEKVLGVPLALVEQGEAVVLFKPQFQVGPENVGRGGVVTDGAAVKRARAAFEDWLADEGWSVAASCDSPVRGGDGNREYLLHLTRQSG